MRSSSLETFTFALISVCHFALSDKESPNRQEQVTVLESTTVEEINPTSRPRFCSAKSGPQRLDHWTARFSSGQSKSAASETTAGSNRVHRFRFRVAALRRPAWIADAGPRLRQDVSRRSGP
jgi:hypothetical protein